MEMAVQLVNVERDGVLVVACEDLECKVRLLISQCQLDDVEGVLADFGGDPCLCPSHVPHQVPDRIQGAYVGCGGVVTY